MKILLRLIAFDIKRIIKNPIIYLGMIICFGVVAFNTDGTVPPETQAEYEDAMGYLTYEEFQSLDMETFIQEQTYGGTVIPVYEDYMTQDERLELEDAYGDYFSTQDYSSLEEELIRLDEEGSVVFYGMYDAEQLTQIDGETYEKVIHSLFGPYASYTDLNIERFKEDGTHVSAALPPDQAMDVGESRAAVENFSAPYARQLIRISMLFMSLVSALLIIQLCGDDMSPKRITFFRGTNVNAWKYCLSKIMAASLVTFVGVFLSTFFIFLYDYIQYQDSIWGYALMDYFFYLIVISVVSLIFISCCTMLILYLSKNQLITIVVIFIIIVNGTTPAAPGAENFVVPYGMKLSQFVPSVSESLWGVDVGGLYLAHQLFYLFISTGLLIGCKMSFSRLIRFGK